MHAKRPTRPTQTNKKDETMMDEDAGRNCSANPFLWRGAETTLSACRTSSSGGGLEPAALQQILDHAGEKLLLGPVNVLARFQKETYACNDNDDMEEEDGSDGDDKNIGTTSSTSTMDERAWVSGKVVIASKHLYFWWVLMRDDDDKDHGPTASSTMKDSSSSSRNNNNKDTDLQISAYSINLHALLAADDEHENDDANNADGAAAPSATTTSAVYMQISTSGEDDAWQNNNDDEDDAAGSEQLFELTLKPTSTSTAAVPEDIQQTCQQLFDAISKMVALNPIDPNNNGDDDTDEMNGGAFGDGSGGWITSENDYSCLLMDPPAPSMRTTGGHETTSDDLVCAPLTNTSEQVTEDERSAMLERLDNLLIVPPEYEINDDADVEGDGQFDDADEDDEIL